jgi:hypothetical protein
MILMLLQLKNKRNRDSHKKLMRKVLRNNKVLVSLRMNYLRLKSKYWMILELILHTTKVRNGKC